MWRFSGPRLSVLSEMKTVFRGIPGVAKRVRDITYGNEVHMLRDFRDRISSSGKQDLYPRRKRFTRKKR